MPRRRRNVASMARQDGDRLCNPPPRQQRQTSSGREQLNQQPPQRASAAEADDLEPVVLPIPASVCSPPSVPIITNIDRFLKSVSPLVPLQNLSEVNSNGSRMVEMDSHPFFSLEDLWESFHEWSVYGAGVSLLLNGKDPVEQFYVPYLSGIQLFKDTSRHSSQIRVCEEGSSANFSSNSTASKEFISGLCSTADFAGSSRTPFFQYFEHEPPHYRQPFTDKIWEFSSQFPELMTSRSCDLLPTSWICVAWYPIYRIPVVPKLQHLEASFLAFYSLSTQSNTIRVTNNDGDPADKYPLSIFGLVSCKFLGSMLSSNGTQEHEQESSLLQAAEAWLGRQNVMLPDYRFFRSHHPNRR